MGFEPRPMIIGLPDSRPMIIAYPILPLLEGVEPSCRTLEQWMELDLVRAGAGGS